jgi:hypothetical protein
MAQNQPKRRVTPINTSSTELGGGAAPPTNNVVTNTTGELANKILTDRAAGSGDYDEQGDY